MNRKSVHAVSQLIRSNHTKRTVLSHHVQSFLRRLENVRLDYLLLVSRPKEFPKWTNEEIKYRWVIHLVSHVTVFTSAIHDWISQSLLLMRHWSRLKDINPIWDLILGLFLLVVLLFLITKCLIHMLTAILLAASKHRYVHMYLLFDLGELFFSWKTEGESMKEIHTNSHDSNHMKRSEG